MECVAPSAQSWRDQVEDWDDDYASKELSRAWAGRPFGDARTLRERPQVYHDWTNFRAATLREARRRGLDISVTGLGT